MDWTLAILIVTLAVSVVFHYFNGGIQPQRGLPRVRPPVKAHISVLLALIALDKALGYVLQRWSLVNSQDGYVNGAGYTDVHARLPAETLLIYVSIFAAVILLFNIRRQGWTLPVLAIGIWAFVALVVGIIYPALLQALKVTPAQSSLEAPYIQRNITATRAAYGLNNVQIHNFPADPSITPSQTVLATPTINNIRQWDPDPSISLQTFQREQAIKGYYAFPSLGVDRYTVNGQMTPVLIGVRDISSANLASPSWVNTHLQYTHGNGAAVALANQNNTSNPVYAVSGVPPTSTDGVPAITQPNVYFGLGETGYVVANTKQLEVDYQENGTSVESHYKGTGGVQLSSIFTRAAFALRLGDFNLLISSQITDKSRIMFVRDPVAMAEKAAPFLTFDHDPYAVINSSPGPDDRLRRRHHHSADFAAFPGGALHRQPLVLLGRPAQRLLDLAGDQARALRRLRGDLLRRAVGEPGGVRSHRRQQHGPGPGGRAGAPLPAVRAALARGILHQGLAFVLALIGASGTVGQWNNWILFRHGGSFHVTDPQFHKDVGFYVFKLPFLIFIVDWTLAILIVTLAVSVVFHYFNGGIQPQRGLPRVRPPVKAHISVLLALIALDKAVRVRPAALVAGELPGRLRQRSRVHRRARPPAGGDAAHLRVDLRRRDPALQHPAPGLDPPGAGHRDLGLRGAGRGHHLSRRCCRRSRSRRRRARSRRPTSNATSPPRGRPTG